MSWSTTASSPGFSPKRDGSGAVVVGMGLNVRGDWFPAELFDIATFVERDRARVVGGVARRVTTHRLDHLDGIVADASRHSATLGRTVRVELAHETFEGTARALTDEGYLVVDDRVVTAGDVVHLRPA